MNLKISSDLSLPLDAATTAQAILAIRGAGKSYTGRVFVEELSRAGVQTVIIDPTGVWYGVRSSADGKSAGLPFIIMGGNHADVPLEETAGEVVAEFVVESGCSVVLDLSLLRKAAQKRFVADLAEHLYHLKGRAGKQSPLHVVLDEADRFAPQKPQPEFMRLLGAIEDWVRLGRSRGFGVTMISQRAALTNKDVLTQVETLIVLRTTSPQDRKAMSAWVEENASVDEFAAIKASMSSMKNGQAWVWSPLLEILKQVQIRHITTFDSMATPKIGQVKAEPKQMAAVDLDALKGRIAETIERVKANDPTELRRRLANEYANAKRIIEWVNNPERKPANTAFTAGPERQIAYALEAKLNALRSGVKSKPSETPRTLEKRIEVQILKDVQIKRLEAMVPAFGKKADSIINGLTELIAALKIAKQPITAIRPLENFAPLRDRVVERISIPKEFAPQLVEKDIRGVVMRANGNGDIGPSHQRILNALAVLESLGVPQGRRAQVGLMAKMTISGGYGQRVVGELKTAGLIAYPPGGGLLQLTEAGRQHANADAGPQTSAEVQTLVKSMVGPSHQKILAALIEVHPNALSRADLGTVVGIDLAGGYGQRVVGELKTLGAIEYPSQGQVKASEILFL